MAPPWKTSSGAGSSGSFFLHHEEELRDSEGPISFLMLLSHLHTSPQLRALAFSLIFKEPLSMTSVLGAGGTCSHGLQTHELWLPTPALGIKGDDTPEPLSQARSAHHSDILADGSDSQGSWPIQASPESRPHFSKPQTPSEVHRCGLRSNGHFSLHSPIRRLVECVRTCSPGFPLPWGKRTKCISSMLQSPGRPRLPKGISQA